jgi:hypothetical protein
VGIEINVRECPGGRLDEEIFRLELVKTIHSLSERNCSRRTVNDHCAKAVNFVRHDAQCQ